MNHRNSLHCQFCKQPAVYGDARNWWIGIHGAWTHKAYWRLKYRFITCRKEGHNYIYDGPTLGGDWIKCTNCNKLEEYLPGVREPKGYTKCKSNYKHS